MKYETKKKSFRTRELVAKKSLITSYGLKNNLLTTSSAEVLKATELAVLENSLVKHS